MLTFCGLSILVSSKCLEGKDNTYPPLPPQLLVRFQNVVGILKVHREGHVNECFMHALMKTRKKNE